MPKAIHVRKDNLDYIEEYGRELGFDLSHIKDNAEYNAEDGYDTYLITDGTPELNNVTFTDMTETGFRDLWRFTEHENPKHFVNIERV